MLIRPKKGQTAQDRLDQLLSQQLFNFFKLDLSKVFAVKGDISLPDLGISEEDEELLTRDVSVVFHSAATIRFTAPLRYSY